MTAINSQAHEAEELNLKQLLAALKRRRLFIIAGLALGGLAGALITASTKQTWMGSFEIVLDPKSHSSGLGNPMGSTSLLANLSFLNKSAKRSELQTEVKILQSPSVLRPVFEEVRAQKASQGEDMEGYRFRHWASNLSVNLEKGTEVLSISYRDTNKNQILPVLRSLSDAYQNYSIRERNDSLKNAIKYAQEQTQIYRERSDASFRKLNSFGLTYGIASQTKGSAGGIDIGKLLSSSNSKDTALSFSGGSESSIKTNGSDPLSQLAQINQELIRQQQTFTANDPIIIALKRERDSLRRYIESSALGSIAYPGKQSISKEQAQNILIRHQELERKANRDQSTLSSMESALLSLQLEQARASTPWQLISNPTLLERPVAPRPGRNLAIGFTSGLLLGCAAALLADQRSGRIFDMEQFKQLLPFQLLLELPSAQPQTWNDSLRLPGLGNSQGRSLAILPLGELQPTQVNKVRDILKQTRKTNVEICGTTLAATSFESLLLLAAPGSIERSHLDRLIQELGLQRTPVIGWIWLDQNPFNA